MRPDAETTRREFVAAASAAAGSVLLDPAGALAADRLPRRRHRHRKAVPPLHQIEHVVVLMQENCSFDRYMGTLSGVRGFSDPKPLRLANGNTVFQQPVAGTPVSMPPWHLDTSRSSPCSVPIDNGWGPMHSALDGGKMDGWVSGEGPYAMSYYTRGDVPWHMALADGFTVCDGYYSSVLGPTNPNRLVSMTGTIDPEAKHGGPVTDNSESPPYTWTTYPERLQARRISWRVYQQADNFDDNALAWFKRYQDAKPGSPLYDNGMARRPAGAFADDVAAGRLPQVSWIIAPTAQSEHPGNAPGPGAQFCDGILKALWAHPQVWAKTVLFLTYDEPGGFFDHVRPPLPPPGTKDEFVGGEPIGLGFRVPTIVCSPWTRGGFVCSDTFDHTSTLRFLERRFGVREPQISAWRRKVCGDLTSTLDLRHRDMSIPKLPATAPLAAASENACQAFPPGVPPPVGAAPKQEPGHKRRRGKPARGQG